MSNPINGIQHEYRTLFCIDCHHQFTVPIRCSNRFCNECSGSTRSRVRRRLTGIIKAYNLPSGHRFKHITLAIRNQVDARDMAKFLLSSFRRLRQRQLWSRMVDGGAYVLEVTGGPGSWHLHIHVLCAALRIPWHRLLRDWNKITGSRSVYIQNCNTSQVISYVTKYISKTTVPEALQIEVSQSLKGTRMFQPFGSWHSLSVRIPKEKAHCPHCDSTRIECLEIIFRQVKLQSPVSKSIYRARAPTA
jgi:hypothetical protein